MIWLVSCWLFFTSFFLLWQLLTQHFVSNQSPAHNNNIPEFTTAAAFWCGGSQIQNPTIYYNCYIITKCVHFLLDNTDDSQPIKIHLISNHSNNNCHKNYECTIGNSHSTTTASRGNGRVPVAPLFYTFPPSVLPLKTPPTFTTATSSAVWMITTAVAAAASIDEYKQYGWQDEQQHQQWCQYCLWT